MPRLCWLAVNRTRGPTCHTGSCLSSGSSVTHEQGTALATQVGAESCMECAPVPGLQRQGCFPRGHGASLGPGRS